jgi:probable HAF family extracellular repeat protein
MGALLKRAGRLCDRNQALRGSWSAMIRIARCVAAASVLRRWRPFVAALLGGMALTPLAPTAPASAQTATTPLQLSSPVSAIAGSSTATAISGDGGVIVGNAVENSSGALTHAFSWTSTGKPTDLGSLVGQSGNSFASAVSVDGITIVGQSDTSLTATTGVRHAFFLSGGSMKDLGSLIGPTGTSLANGVAVTSSGTLIVGSSDTSVFVSGMGFPTLAHAVLWTSGSGPITDLGTLSTPVGKASSVANAISANGGVIVGQSTTTAGSGGNPLIRGVKWTVSATPPTLTELFPIAGVTGSSSANAVNNDGSIIVGSSITNIPAAFPGPLAAPLSHAVMWTLGNNAQDLGVFSSTPAQYVNTRFPVSTYSYSATGVSGDGGIIVGSYSINDGVFNTNDNLGGFRYTAAGGIQDLQTLLSSAGVPMQGITILSARAISGNGQFIVGQANFPGAVDVAYVVQYIDAPPACPTSTVASTVGGAIDRKPSPGNIAGAPSASPLVAAVLPASRSVRVGCTATAFATIINAGAAAASGCAIAPLGGLPLNFLYQTTNPTTNALTGTANTPIDIAAGAAQSFLIALTPTAAFSATNVNFSFACANAAAAPTQTGLNTLLLSASTSPVPDVVALAASGDPGIVDIPGTNGTGVFAVATVNLGADATITASAHTGTASLPVTLSICETVPATGACMASPAASVSTDIQPNATPTFGIFAAGGGAITFDPANNRVFVQFADPSGNVRGETSVAVRTQ